MQAFVTGLFCVRLPYHLMSGDNDVSQAINRILGSGRRVTDELSSYQPYIDSGGRPQMGFSITRANGDMDGFLFHSLDNLRHQTRNGQEFLSFTHRGTAVTMQGTRLQILFRAIMRHTLMEIHEENGTRVELDEAAPTITKVAVTLPDEMRDGPRLAKG